MEIHGVLNFLGSICLTLPCSFIFPQAVKKAKQFEVQKAVRRLKQAKDTAQNEKEISKLEAVLTSIKTANIEALSDKAAASVGLSARGHDEPADPKNGEIDTVQIAERRILSARCVVDQLNANVAAIDALRSKAAKQQQPNTVDAGTTTELLPSANSEEEVLDSEAPKSEEESEKEPDEEALNALAKLMSRKNAKGASDDSATGEDSDEDSGVIEDLSEGSISTSLGEEGNGSDSDADVVPAAAPAAARAMPSRHDKAAKVVKKPKKPKNRLGQRARRQLAEQAHGRHAVHLHEPEKRKREDGRGEERKVKHAISGDDAEVLHPSWAARRQEKQKLSISAVPAAGKKIVFDDGSGMAAAAAPAAVQHRKYESEKEGPLHPSWVFKKKQAEAQRHIQPAQGKKIVFDD